MESNTENNNQKVQAIFNKIIEAKLYPYQGTRNQSSSWMCLALTAALVQRVITKKEYITATADIQDYLGSHESLNSFLLSKGLPYGTAIKLNIYKNWQNRPF